MAFGAIIQPCGVLLICAICVCQVTCRFADCGLGSRYPGFTPSNCSHPCNVISSKGDCTLNAVCFFKSVISLIEPAGFEHYMNLSTVETVNDAYTRVRGLDLAVFDEETQFDELVNTIAATYEQFFIDQIPSNRSEEHNSTSSSTCMTVNKLGIRKVNATCYFQSKLDTKENGKYSHLLDFRAIVDDFNEYNLVCFLIRRIKNEKTKLRTFVDYVVQIYDVMVDVEVSNGNRNGVIVDVSRYGCESISFSVPQRPGFVGGLRSQCPGVCMKTDSNGECRQDLECFLLEFSY